MSLLSICAKIAEDVGVALPESVFGSGEREAQELVSYTKDAADEIARRADWGELTKTSSISWTSLADAMSLPADFSRLVQGQSVTFAGKGLRAISRAEWAAAPSAPGTPRYYLLEGDKVSFWPYMATGSSASVAFQSSAWCSNGTDAWAADADTAKISEDLIAKGAIARWRRQKGMPYQDQEAEFEAELAALAGFNNGGRV